MKSLSHDPEQPIMGKHQDALGKWHSISPLTRKLLLQAMRVETDSVRSPTSSVSVVYAGQTRNPPGPGELTLEDGTVMAVGKVLPRDLPLGYHQLRSWDGGHIAQLIVSPGACYLPKDLRTWGWAVQLYALRSRQSWGLGDLADLRHFGRWSRRAWHTGFILVNPLCAAVPVLPQEPSPYYPSSRRFLNPLYLRIEDIPGARSTQVPLEKWAAIGRVLNQERKIDRDAVFRLKMKALEKIWTRFDSHPRFEQFCAEQGAALRQYALFCALAEHQGTGWTRWPAHLRHPQSSAVARFAASHSRHIRFHQWVQWLLDEQLAQAGKEIPLMQDLPIGLDPGGADAWAWQDLLAQGVSVGAPPDEYNTQGQNWGLMPFIPHRLRASGYEPFRQTIRALLRHAGSLRIDHVMGLFRLYWIPPGKSPKDGAYVRYPAEELLAILALESQRAKAVVIGEDLGTVEAAARAQLRRQRILSYRLLWFEAKPMSAYPRQAMTAVTTHDLFTIAGLWTGEDVEVQQRLGLHPNVTGTKAILQRLRRQIVLPDSKPVQEAIVRTHQLLAQAPSLLLTATLDDALAVTERPNMPGTLSSQWPNWSLALPKTLEQIRLDPLVRKVAQALRRRRNSSL